MPGDNGASLCHRDRLLMVLNITRDRPSGPRPSGDCGRRRRSWCCQSLTIQTLVDSVSLMQRVVLQNPVRIYGMLAFFAAVAIGTDHAGAEEAAD